MQQKLTTRLAVGDIVDLGGGVKEIKDRRVYRDGRPAEIEFTDGTKFKRSGAPQPVTVYSTWTEARAQG